ncbi:ankyrin repeat-containing domain protein [Zopfochytrium polystomum]|nr:ankyrin repeat-containing domain protein [Zopfochytrium polystomum]
MVALLLDRGADLHVNKDKVLSLAARVASRKTFSLLVERGIDPKVNDGEALASASWGGNLDIVELLLELRVVRCLPWALSEASSQAHPKVVAKLFEAGARPEWVEPEEFVVLGEKKHWDLVTSLLKTHSALQTKAICGELLRPAVQQGNIEVVKLLLELVPDLQTVKLSHLGDGARTGNVELVELLLDGYDGKSSSDTLTAALKSAAASGKAEALERLVSNGADIKSAGSDAVAAAAAAGHLSMIKRLLELGVDVNCNGESVRLAAEGGHEQVVEFLLDHIANDTVLAKDAIEVAVKRGDTRVASLLFARESSDGYRLDFKSLVEAAIPTNKWELVELILAHSGKQKNDLEAQALEQSSKDGKLDVLQGLISTPGREVSTALVEASRSGHLEAVQLLLDYKSIQGTVDLNKAADAAVKENHLHVAKLLHSRGADMSKHLLAALGAGYDMTAFVLDVGKFKPEDLSDRLLSAMSWANQNELGRFNFGLHQLLLDHGADVHLRDDILMTDHAFFGRHHVLKFVLSRGGNANARNGRALEIAVMRAGRKTVKVLLEGGADVWKNDGAALKAVLETSVDKEGTKEELRAHFEKIGVQIPAGLDEAFWTAFLRDEIGVRV